jgi:tripartite ATP-independent transporter DctM subunit
LGSLALGGLAIGVALVLTLIGVPVASALGLVGLAGLFMVGGQTLLASSAETLVYNALNQYSFIVIPTFMLMGILAHRAGVTSDLYEAFYRILARVRGSLFIVTILSSAGFATISGSTVVSAAVFTRLALPQMKRFNYDSGVGAGCIAAAGTFASLIPPSMMMVIYALLTGESIGRLFVAGVIPGIFTAIAYVVFVFILVRVRPAVAPEMGRAFSTQEKLTALTRTGPFLVLAAIVVGGIYSGLVAPTAAGAIGALGALGIAVWRGVGKPKMIREALEETAVSSGTIFLVLIGGLLFARFLVYSGFISELVDAISASGIAPWQVLLAVVIANLILGMFMDTVSITVVTVPFLHPIMVGLGYDPIWFGIVLIKLIEISAITPPVGLNLFAVMASARTEITTRELFRGVIPFICVELVLLTIIIALPKLSLWLPEQIYGP